MQLVQEVRIHPLPQKLGPLDVLPGVGEFPLAEVGNGPQVIGVGVLGVDVQGLAEVGNGLVQLPLVGVGQTPVDIDPGVVGFDLQGLVIVGEGRTVILSSPDR